MSVIVALEDAEVRMCLDIAVNRWMMKVSSKNKPNYEEGKKAGKLEHQLVNDLRSILTEYAVAKYYALPHTLPFYVNSEHPRRVDHPDVGENIEVRTLRTAVEVPIWQKDVNKSAVVVAGRVVDMDNPREVELYGWIHSRFATQPQWWFDEEQDWRVPVSALEEVDSLRVAPPIGV